MSFGSSSSSQFFIIYKRVYVIIFNFLCYWALLFRQSIVPEILRLLYFSVNPATALGAFGITGPDLYAFRIIRGDLLDLCGVAGKDQREKPL